MKNIQYLLIAAFVLLLVGCEKHEIEFNPSDPVTGMAQFQVMYVEPIAVSTANRIDSMFVNGMLYNSINMPQTMAVNAVTPYPNGFYTAPAGMTNIKLYRGADANGSAVVPATDKVKVFLQRQSLALKKLPLRRLGGQGLGPHRPRGGGERREPGLVGGEHAEGHFRAGGAVHEQQLGGEVAKHVFNSMKFK